MITVNRDELPIVGMSHEFIGRDYGVGTSIFFVNAPPGRSVRLHRHSYDEIIVVQEGRARCVVGDESREAKAGDIIVIPAGTPHSFTSIGDRPLRQMDLHANPEFVSEWLEENE